MRERVRAPDTASTLAGPDALVWLAILVMSLVLTITSCQEDRRLELRIRAVEQKIDRLERHP